MKKNPRAMQLRRQWAGWLLCSYVLSIILGVMPPTLATQGEGSGGASGVTGSGSSVAPQVEVPDEIPHPEVSTPQTGGSSATQTLPTAPSTPSEPNTEESAPPTGAGGGAANTTTPDQSTTDNDGGNDGDDVAEDSGNQEDEGAGEAQTQSLTGADTTYGMIRFQVPNDGDSSFSYDLRVEARFYQNNGTQVPAPNTHSLGLYLNSGNLNRTVSFLVDADNGQSGYLLYADLSNLNSNTAYLFPNVVTSMITPVSPYHNAFDYVEITLTVSSMTYPQKVTFSGGNTQKIAPQWDTPINPGDGGLTGSHQYTNFVGVLAGWTTSPTFHTFEVEGGGYTFSNLLNNYNTVSFSSFQGTHVIGPLVSLDYAARTGYGAEYAGSKLATVTNNTGSTASNTGRLVINDYSHGVSSFVGEILRDSTTPEESMLNINYGIDTTPSGNPSYDPNFDTDLPPLYTKLDGLSVFTAGTLNDPIEYVAPTSGDTSAFISPNNKGRNALVLQNNNYVVENTMVSMVQTASDHLYSDGVIPGETSRASKMILIDLANAPQSTDFYTLSAGDGTNVNLTLYYGNSYVISNSASKVLISIDLITTQTDKNTASGFVYGQDFDNTPTTINFSSNALPYGTRNGESHRIFPQIKMNGSQLTVSNGYGGEYYDQGNKIIWNLPNTTGKIAFRTVGENIPGHFIAPQGDIRNYSGDTKENATWSGGNINGMMIGNSIHIGAMELHMWPYLTEVERAGVTVELPGVKTITGGSPDGWQFTISSAASNDFKITETTVTSADIGEFSFQIAFTEAGTYTFKVVEEQIDPNNALAGVTFDKSEYTVEYLIEDNGANTLEVAAGYPKITQTLGSDGSSVGSNTTLLFHNSYGVTELPDTGGRGTASFVLVGMGMMALAFILTENRRKQNLL